ncbi:MAG: transcriptional regulator, partial [Candidatus Nanohaloarchaea archaeon]|nr:transcriptional regulator [Candidatus Nanohaloarchaea archaeon]
FKAITEREGDLEDCALIARQGAVDWNQIMDEIEEQERKTERYFSFAVLDTLDMLVDRYGIEVPIRERLASYCLENALILTLEDSKTIDDLREELDFPDHQIYNKLQKLEEAGKIEVDRSGKLNRYQKLDL